LVLPLGPDACSWRDAGRAFIGDLARAAQSLQYGQAYSEEEAVQRQRSVEPIVFKVPSGLNWHSIVMSLPED